MGKVPSWTKIKGWAQRLLAVGAMTTSALLASCTPDSQPHVTALVMPAPDGFGVQVIEHKSLASQTADANPAASEIAFLQHEKISSSAYFKYKLSGGAAYKVKMNVFTERGAELEHWKRRYGDDLRGQAKPLGNVDEGFELPGRISAFLVGPVMVEILATGGAPRLSEFTVAYIDFLKQQLS